MEYRIVLFILIKYFISCAQYLSVRNIEIMTEILKKYNTIGCCGIDCGLCPRFHTKGDSVCPGCGGLNFREKHPSCGFVTCCVIKNRLEVCSDCREYPCSRFDSERKGYDSFVTHNKVFVNLDYIKSNGINCFIEIQKTRMELLTDFLDNYDDGRSKSFFCLCCALLPLDKLQETHRFIDSPGDSLIIKEKNKQLKGKLQMIAENLKIDLKLKNKK
jgi:hypothetical protein